jgi:hypothetical protein
LSDRLLQGGSLTGQAKDANENSFGNLNERNYFRKSKTGGKIALRMILKK